MVPPRKCSRLRPLWRGHSHSHRGKKDQRGSRNSGRDGSNAEALTKSTHEAEASQDAHTIEVGDVGLDAPVGADGDAAVPPPPAIANVSPIASIAAPFASALQSVSVWAASLTLPSLYLGRFSDLFSFLSLELSSVFAGLPAISTPIIQVAAAIAVLSLVVYFFLEDHRVFQTTLARYVWRRDAVDGALQCASAGGQENSPIGMVGAAKSITRREAEEEKEEGHGVPLEESIAVVAQPATVQPPPTMVMMSAAFPPCHLQPTTNH